MVDEFAGVGVGVVFAVAGADVVDAAEVIGA